MSVELRQLQELTDDVKSDEPLARHTTLRIGGKAKFFATPADEAELSELLRTLRANSEKYFIVGAGSNLLFKNPVYDGVVVKLGGAFRGIVRLSESSVSAGAAVALPTFQAYAVQNGLSGLEHLSGIPGTVGGAVAGNAGTKYGSTELTLERVVVLDENLERKEIAKKDIAFGYRETSLKKCVVLKASFSFVPAKPSDILKKIDEYMAWRTTVQPHLPSAGSVFKNPAGGTSAGKLIDDCGLRGKKIGGAMVSPEHANFIVNTGNATAQDFIGLMNLAAVKVREKFGVTLEPEIEVVE